MINENRLNILSDPSDIAIYISIRQLFTFNIFTAWIANFGSSTTNLQLNHYLFSERAFFLTYKGDNIVSTPLPMQKVQQYQQVSNV